MVALNMIDHVGPVRVRQLLELFGDAPTILSASKQQLLRVHGIGEEAAESISSWEKGIDLNAEIKRINEFGCRIVIQSDPEYPESLRQIYDPPIALYVKGSLSAKDKNSIAMVGSRMTTHYGIETARKLAYQLAYLGITVVSGGARGIDTAAHQGAADGERPNDHRAWDGHQSGISFGECGVVRADRRVRRNHHAVRIQPPGG